MTETPCLPHQGGPAGLEPRQASQLTLHTGEVKRSQRYPRIHAPAYFSPAFFSFFYKQTCCLCTTMEVSLLIHDCALIIKLSFSGDDHWASRALISTAVSLSWAALSQLSHHLPKSWDLWRDKERRHQNILIALHTPPLPLPSFFSFCLSSAITITGDAFSDMVVVKKRPGYDINSLVLVMWNKHQLTTHQSLRDSPILFRGEWIIRPNPNTPSAPWLPGTIVLGHTLHTAQIASARVKIPGQAVKYRNQDV